MNKKRLVVAVVALISMVLVNAGCAAIGTAIGAGMAYGIYQATHK